ncbi:amino acid adenylation domain-containing protein [Zymobacter sp. IVIA_5232.4 C2]|uniref:non-ribosomal peptide synthetase n=1 Tax=Zymobacter sp. IVIA_5232.4 C2 TaxID=3394855 RepID=UPI0039C0EB35
MSNAGPQRDALKRMSREDKVRLLARARQQGAARKSVSTVRPLTPQPCPQEGVPLSLAQRRLWILAQMGGDSADAYVLSGGFRLQGRVDEEALREALRALLAHHDVLRMRIVTVDGEPRQQVTEVDVDQVLEVRDLHHMNEEDQPLLPTFVLSQSPLWRVQLLRVSEDVAVLKLALHHLIADGWSLALFMDALSAYYARAQSGEAALPRPALQYTDYVQWQQGLLEDGTLTHQQQYWVDRLRGAPERLTLPTDHPRPERQAMAGGRLPIRFDATLTQAVKALGQQHGCTPFMVLLASWSVLMARLSGQDDIVTGIPIAGRGQQALETMLGMFVNTQALRVDLSAAPDTASVLAQVRRIALEAQQHADIPFEQVVEAVAPSRSLAYSPLFQTMFTLQNTPQGQLTLPGIALEALTSEDAKAPFDLSVALEEIDGELVGSLFYATALFDADTLTQWLSAWTQLLSGMVHQPATAVSALPMLSDDLRDQVIEGFNATAHDYPREASIHALMERQVAQTPDAVAVVYAGTSLTYAELNDQADRLAHWLVAQGVAADQRVAIALPRGLSMVVAVLAVLKAGGAYVPLDPAYPDDRLRYILEDSRPAVLITTPDFPARMAPLPDALTLALMESDTAPWSHTPESEVALPNGAPDNLAYLIYTSGSTGQPKGVMVPHRAVVNFLCHQQRQLGVDERDRLLAITTLSFDIHVLELFLPLISGAQLHIASDALRLDGAALADYLRDENITLFQATPATWKLLLANQWQGAPHLTGLIGGEACPLALAHDIAARVSTLWNMYGPTETTVWSTMQPLSAREAQVSIGRPIANTRVYVLDEQQHPVPVGVVGELYIAGAGVTHGYLGRPELTAERFLPDPFVADEQARMYRTGDLVRWRRDGTLDYLGRNDFQVKIRGFRIELGEIEAALQACDGVQDAIVVAHSHTGGEPQLVAYCTPSSDVVLEAAQLKAALAAIMPGYMVPAAFMVLERLPLTPNGKLDRQALPAPDESAFVRQQYEAPYGPLEEGLAALWREVLGVERVGRQDHFFALGGHSLLAVQLMTRVQQRLQHTLNLEALFAHPTLAAMATRLVPAAQEALPDMLPRAAGEDAPLSPAQRRIWFLSRMDSSLSRAYQLHGSVDLKGELDERALRQALDAIAARHEALRTHIIDVDDVPWQRVAAADSGFSLTTLTLTHGDTVPPFTPAMVMDEGPLACGRLVRLGTDHHVLQLAFHHVIADGWSIGIFLRELSEGYAAAHEGREAKLLPLRVQYGDVAIWQQDVLNDERMAAQCQFWVEQLNDAPACLSLPTDRPRPAVQRYDGAAVPVVLDRALTERLHALSRRHGGTVFMTLLAAWGTLMARLSGQRDIVVGTPVAGRDHPDIEHLIGMFVNTLPLRLNLDASPSVEALLAQVKATTLAAQQHAQVPFEHMVEAVAPERSLAYSPVFQTMLALQNTPEASLTLPGLTLTPREDETVSSQCDLSLLLREEEGRLIGAVHFATALFDEQTIARWIGYWVRLLEGMTATPEQPVMALPMLSEDEHCQLIHGMNQTAADYPLQAPLPQMFAQQALQQPEALAVCTHEGDWQYGELDRSANQLAHWLISHGVGAERRVAVLLERGRALPLALLAVLKAGGAYVPLDAAYPDERLGYLVNDCSPVMVLTSSALAARLSTVAPQVTTVVIDESSWASQPDSAPEIVVQPDHLAYVIYTSGSTGHPKGVMVEHRHVANLVHWHCQQFQLREGTPVSCVAGLGFDAAVWELWPALCAGGRVLMPAPEVARDPEGLLAWWQAQPLQISFLPTPVAEWAFSRGMTHPTLRTLLVGGDRLTHRPATDIGFTLVNNYGPTENAVVATSGAIAADDEALHIGRPIDNASVYLLDEQGQPVPLGVVGELYVGGAQVARGYLDRPELTAERFLPDPFATELGARMYRTGDLARWRADGTLEYHGRNDFQVKLRGFRIELGEIEAAIAACEGIDSAIVVTKGGDQQPYLTAYYTVTGSGVTPEALQGQLAERLPAYMVPSAWVPLDALPLTANGKVDRRALPEPDDAARVQRAYEAPQGAHETALADIWSALLGVERVGRHDDFFALGGHSLLGVQLVSRVRAQLKCALSLTALFAFPTLAELATQLDEADPDDVLPAITAQHADGPIPLSLAQQRLWFLSRMDDAASASYVIAGGLRLRGPLNAAALTRALDAIVARHESLRTHMATVEGEPQQIVSAPQVGFPLQYVSLGSPDDTLPPFAPTFDLGCGPLVQAQLVRYRDDDHLLRLALHHVIADGWSMGVLMQELSTLYDAFAAERPDPLPPLALQYRDYAVWQQRYLTSERLQHQQQYWVEQLQHAPECLSLPLDRPRPERQDYRGAQLDVVLPAPLVARLHALSRAQGCTLYMTLVAAWAALMARLSGQDDIVIGTPTAGRQRYELEPLIGMFVNTQALRVGVPDDVDSVRLLAAVRETVLNAQQHADIPFEQIVEAVSPRRSLAHSPVFQVMLGWQAQGGEQPTLSGLSATVLPIDLHTAQCDLSLELNEQEGEVRGVLRYATALFDEATVKRWQGYWARLLEGMAATPERPVMSLSILSPVEYETVTGTFNATQRDYPRHASLAAMFEAQVAATPEAIAVVEGTHTCCYRELNERANRLAHRLLREGLQPHDRVAVALPRGELLVTALLAILKAGGCYVPIDPHYPASRAQFMLADSAPRLLLASTDASAAFAPWPLGLTVLDPEQCLAAPLSEPCINPGRAHDPASPALAYIMYTSGSTGRPKGVMVSQRSVLRLIFSNGYAAFDAHDRVACLANPAFDASTMELWGALLCGGCLVVFDHDTVMDAQAFTAALEHHRVTVMFMTIALFNQHADALQRYLPALRYLMVGGESLDPAFVRRALREGPPQHFLHVYGPTETTTFATAYRMNDANPDVPQMPIGRPISNTTVYVMDAFQQPVPIGVTGELYIGGDGVAEGYLNLPEQTAERFVPDPFTAMPAAPNARLYRTGDLGYWQADGTLMFQGRNDFQVKLRGFRIELGEIEAALLACPEVQHAVVEARGTEASEKRLVAYYTCHERLHIDPETLNQRLSLRLPDYMVPSAWVPLAEIPLTANGKVDRRALPEPDAATYLQAAYEAPQGELECQLAALWQRLLGVEQVGRHDDFFALGGHSLMAVRLVNEAQQQGIEIPLATLFSASRLSELAERLGEALPLAQNVDAPIAFRSTGSERPLFIVPEASGELFYGPLLTSCIDNDIPVYGLHAPDRRQPAFQTVEGAAARLAGMIRGVQPEGPYRLLGWSFGGVLAYEVAAQLLGQDQSVEFVGMLDTRLPDRDDGRVVAMDELFALPDEEQRMDYLVKGDIDALATTDALRARAEALSRTLPLWEVHYTLGQSLDMLPAGWSPEYYHGWLTHRLALLSAEYDVPRLPIVIDLFVAADEPEQAEEGLGWHRVLPEAQVVCTAVPGTHARMVSEPYVHTLGEAISETLKTRRAAVPSSHYMPAMTLQSGQTGAPTVLCIPGAGDNVFSFMPLVRSLPSDWHVIGLQPRGLWGQEVPHSDVTSAAAFYRRSLEGQLPAGPLYIVGHSFGGWVALALAQQLEAEGIALARVVIADSRVPECERKEISSLGALQKLIDLLEMQGVPLTLERERLARMTPRQRLTALHGAVTSAGIMSARTPLESLHSILRVLAINLRSGYCPTQLPQAPATLVVAADTDATATHRWQQRWPQVEVVRSQGNHVQMLKSPYVEVLCRALTA